MDKCKKCSLLDELASPLGYTYHCKYGFFSSTRDAWQKTAGYTRLYDYMAPRFQMVIDALPVYFDYQGKTWLIEFWKGQYGINAGAEIGIYHADRLLSEEEYKTALFKAVDNDEMLPCSLRLCLCGHGTDCVRLSDIHWWLTAFLPGCFCDPSDLNLTVTVCFPDVKMLDAFYEGLIRAGHTVHDITIQYLCITFTLHTFYYDNLDLPTRLWRRHAQRMNRIFCSLFVWITRPFLRTEDRILYLYYYIPSAFRRLLRFRRFHGRCHRKNGSTPPKYHREGSSL